jgi:hypothetical protein
MTHSLHLSPGQRLRRSLWLCVSALAALSLIGSALAAPAPSSASTPPLTVEPSDRWDFENGVVISATDVRLTIPDQSTVSSITIDWTDTAKAISAVQISDQPDGSGRVTVAGPIAAGSATTSTITLTTPTASYFLWVVLTGADPGTTIDSLDVTYAPTPVTALDEDFESITIGQRPDWAGSPASTTSVQAASGGGQALRFDHTGVNWMRADFSPSTSGVSTLTARVLLPQSSTVFGIHLGANEGGNVAASFAASLYARDNGRWSTNNGATSTTLATYTTNTWHTIELIVDGDSQTFDLIIDGSTALAGGQLRNAVSVGALYLNTFGSGSGSLSIDDVLVTHTRSHDLFPLTGIYPLLGLVEPREASEISGSPWSVGGETVDRDIAYYDGFSDYLGGLGAKRIRLQAGWAKTESTPGVYDYAWLDAVIDDAVAQGVEPWLELSYGNPAYSGGGSINIGGGLPTSSTALAAWDDWVEATVTRYADRVDEWEIWNEPNGAGISAADFADFHARTATIVRSVQPSAVIIGVAAAGTATSYIDGFLARLQSTGNLGLVDEISFHPYANNPDSTYAALGQLATTIAGYSPTITLRQGENGAPVVGGECGAMNDHDWTEFSAAKWNARRLLGDLAADLPVTSIFHMVDLVYNAGCTVPVGLLATDPVTKIVTGPRPSYRAVQTITAIIDDRWTRQTSDPVQIEGTTSAVNASSYVRDDGEYLAVAWQKSLIPTESTSSTPVVWRVPGGALTRPLIVNVLSGEVFAVPNSEVNTDSNGDLLVTAPLSDWPIMLVDAGLLERQESTAWSTDFEADTVGQVPSGFSGSASGTVVTAGPDAVGNALAFAHNGVNWLRHDIAPLTDDLVSMRYRVWATQSTNTFGAHVAQYQGANVISAFSTGLYTLKDGQWRTYSGTTAIGMGAYSTGGWHEIEVLVDQSRQRFWMTIDGWPEIVAAPVRNELTSGTIGSVILNAFDSGTGTVYYDDFVVATASGPTSLFSVSP